MTAKIKKEYIHYGHIEVYAIYYRTTHTIYYNLDFAGKLKLIIYR